MPKATVNVKPNLQIGADDVVCTHGCTVSDLEEEELFYIQSRGLSPTTARSLLVAGFGLEIVSKLEHEDLRTRVSGLCETRWTRTTSSSPCVSERRETTIHTRVKEAFRVRVCDVHRDVSCRIRIVRSVVARGRTKMERAPRRRAQRPGR